MFQYDSVLGVMTVIFAWKEGFFLRACGIIVWVSILTALIAANEPPAITKFWQGMDEPVSIEEVDEKGIKVEKEGDIWR